MHSDQQVIFFASLTLSLFRLLGVVVLGPGCDRGTLRGWSVRLAKIALLWLWTRTSKQGAGGLGVDREVA